MTPSVRAIWKSTAASAWAGRIRCDPTIGRRCCRCCCIRHRVALYSWVSALAPPWSAGRRCRASAVHGVELSREVVELLPWFVNPAAAGPSPRVTVADARRYVAADTGQYDVIIADLFHPALDGSGALYTRRAFRGRRKRLAPGGVFCQWLPLYQLDLPSLRAIIRGFLEVYPGGSAWLNHYSVRTPMLALDRSAGWRLPRYRTRSAARLSNAAVTSRSYGRSGSRPRWICLGNIWRGPHALSAFAGKGPRNTDDYPFVTFDARAKCSSANGPAMVTAARRHADDATRSELSCSRERPSATR